LTSRAGAGLPDAKVAAREIVAAMGDGLNDPRLAAQQLGVQQVVCGELRAVADGWSLLLAVVDGLSGFRRWSHRFALPALPRAQLPQRIGEIAARAARPLLVEMHRSAAAIAAARPLGDRSAGDLALQGWARIYDGISPGNLEAAQQFFEQAVEKDPSHLRGLGGVNTTNFWRALLGWAPDRELALRRVLESAARLEKLHPGETLTAFSSGEVADIEQRWSLRLLIYDRLCERDPANSTAHFGRACALLKLARFDECVAEIDEARRLSVDDFRAGWWCSFAACAHLMAGRHAEAAIEAQRSIAANACLPLPPLLLAAALAGDGRPAEGRDVLRQHRLREPQCDRARAEMLLGRGDAGYTQGCSRILMTLEALGIADE
jgi:tetratricopeptide (TPR) repeat protein